MISASRHALLAAVALFLFTFAVSDSPFFGQGVFHVNKDLYSETADPTADIAAAVVTARRSRKRILLEFGGNWCGDCQLLDYYYHQPPNSDILAKHYVIVRVEIGHMDHNMETAKKYQVPVTKGVPALAILDSNGKLLYAEQPKEFEHATPEVIAAFLNRWKG